MDSADTEQPLLLEKVLMEETVRSKATQRERSSPGLSEGTRHLREKVIVQNGHCDSHSVALALPTTNSFSDLRQLISLSTSLFRK